MTTPTQGEHAQTEALKHAEGLEWFAERAPGFGLDPLPLKNTAAFIRRLHAQVAALTAATAAPKVALELPAGDTRTANVYWSEMRGDTLHLCISVDTTAQPAAPQGGAYAELRKEFDLWWNDQMGNEPGRDTSSDSRAFMPYKAWKKATERASNGQAPAGATPEDWNGTYEHAWRMGAQYIMETEAESKKMRQDAGFKWVYAPTAQAAPAAGITVEQVEDAIGLQSTAWDTIGAEKIVEAVIRLANAKAPAAGAVAWPVAPPNAITASVMRDDGGEQPAFCLIAAYRSEKDAMDALAMIAAAPTPAAQADSVLEDAARLEFEMQHGSAIDAARKQGGTHDNH